MDRLSETWPHSYQETWDMVCCSRAASNCRFVERDEFCSLLIGFRELVRADQSDEGIQGLLDLNSGMHYLIEEEKLFPPLERSGP